MRFPQIILLGLALLGPFYNVFGQTSVTEDVLTDEVWRPEAGPYQITRDVAVSSGATLTIRPGTVVEFGFSGTLYVGNGGRVVADSAEFRPVHTRGLHAAILLHEGSAPGSVDIRRSRIDNLYVYHSGGGELVVEETRFTGVSHLRLYGYTPARVTHCTFESDHPIHTRIDVPKSDITENVFTAEAVVFHPGAERIVHDDTIRTYGNLPVSFDNNISVSRGARLTVPPGLEIRLGYFDTFLVNGGATLEIDGARIHPADGSRRFPAAIVSRGDGAAHAQITDSILEDVYLEFSGGTGVVQRTDFVVRPGDPALLNTGSTTVVATGNYWSGEQGPLHSSNPLGNGAVVKGFVEFEPWSSHPNAYGTSSKEGHDGSFRLAGPYPNPATSLVSFSYDVPSITNIQWEIYDAAGRRVLARSQRAHSSPSGNATVDMSQLPSGPYFLRMRAGRHVKISNFVLIK